MGMVMKPIKRIPSTTDPTIRRQFVETPAPIPAPTEMQESININDEDTKIQKRKKLMLANPTQGLGTSGGLL